MSHLPDPAPVNPGDAESYMRDRARMVEDVAIGQHRDGGNAKHIAFQRRMAVYYAEAAAALARVRYFEAAAALAKAPEPAPAADNFEDMLS